MIIYARSPYFIEVNETSQLGSKIELRIWNNPDTKPTDPTYTFTKSIASTTNRKNVYNIAPYVKEYIEAITPSITTNRLWCNVEVKRFKEASLGSYTLVETLTGYATSGYTLYSDGINAAEETSTNYNILVKQGITLNYKEDIYNNIYNQIPFINVITDITSPSEVRVSYKDLRGRNEVIQTYADEGKTMLKIPFRTNSTKFNKGNTIDISYRPTGEYNEVTTSFLIMPICEPKYSPIQCQYINRYGGWQFLTFYKAQTNNIQTQGTTYYLLPDAVNYNPSRAQTKSFNINGNQSIRLNTGWVDENYNDLIQDLLLSETILLDGVPVEVKTTATDLKTSLKDRNINYEIEFNYAFNLINNVV
jgi:hypothetical protein